MPKVKSSQSRRQSHRRGIASPRNCKFKANPSKNSKSQTTQNNESKSRTKHTSTIQLTRNIQADEHPLWYTGIDSLPDGQIIVCDYLNKKIKILQDPNTVVKSLNVNERPRDVSVVSSVKAIVTIPELKQLQFIEVSPSFRSRHVIKLDKECWGVHVADEHIYVTFMTNRGEEAEIRILDMEGQLKKRIINNYKGKPMFQRPYYVTVSEVSKNIFVSDFKTNKVTCLSPDCNVVYQFKKPGLKQLGGLVLDADDNVIVCSLKPSSVDMIATNGKCCRSLLTEKDGLKAPYSVTYRKRDNNILIGIYGESDLFVFSLIQ